jgi:hypothetical protein
MRPPGIVLVIALGANTRTSSETFVLVGVSGFLIGTTVVPPSTTWGEDPISKRDVVDWIPSATRGRI